MHRLEEFDLLIGGLNCHMINSSAFVQSEYHTQDEIIWCVGRAKPIPEWRRVFYLVRDSESWAIALIEFIIIIVILFLITSFEKDPYDIWKSAILTTQAMVNANVMTTVHGLFRFTITWFLFMGLLIQIFWGAFSMNYLTREALQKQVRTFNDLKEYNFHLAATNVASKYLDSEQFDSIEICGNANQCISELNQNDRKAVAISRLYIETLPVGNQFFCFDSTQTINRHSTALLFRKDVQFRLEFERILNRISSGGLVSKWRRDYTRKVAGYESDQVKAVTLKQLSGVFIIMGSIIGVAIIVFILERVIFKKSRIPNSHRFWKTGERLIDGHRHYFLMEKNEK